MQQHPSPSCASASRDGDDEEATSTASAAAAAEESNNKEKDRKAGSGENGNNSSSSSPCCCSSITPPRPLADPEPEPGGRGATQTGKPTRATRVVVEVSPSSPSSDPRITTKRRRLNNNNACTASGAMRTTIAHDDDHFTRKDNDDRLIRYSYETPFLINHTRNLLMNAVTSSSVDSTARVGQRKRPNHNNNIHNHHGQLGEDNNTNFSLSERAAFLKAMQNAPDIVEMESNPIDFLRRENFHIFSAAKRLLSYWTLRFALFDEDRALLPISNLTGRGALNQYEVNSMLLNQQQQQQQQQTGMESSSFLLRRRGTSSISSSSNNNRFVFFEDTAAVRNSTNQRHDQQQQQHPRDGGSKTATATSHEEEEEGAVCEDEEDAGDYDYDYDDDDGDFELHCTRERIRFYMFSLAAMDGLPKRRTRNRGNSTTTGSSSSSSNKHLPKIDCMINLSTSAYQELLQQHMQGKRPHHINRMSLPTVGPLSVVSSVSLMARVMPLKLASLHFFCSHRSPTTMMMEDNVLDNSFDEAACSTSSRGNDDCPCYFHSSEEFPEDIVSDLLEENATSSDPEGGTEIEIPQATAAVTVGGHHASLSITTPASTESPITKLECRSELIAKYLLKQQKDFQQLILQQEREEEVEQELCRQRQLVLEREDCLRAKKRVLREKRAQDKHERKQVKNAKDIFLFLAGLNMNLEEVNKTLSSWIGEVNELVGMYNQQQQQQLATIQAAGAVAGLTNTQLAKLVAEILLLRSLTSATAAPAPGVNDIGRGDQQQPQQQQPPPVAAAAPALQNNVGVAQAAASAAPSVDLNLLLLWQMLNNTCPNKPPPPPGGKKR